MKVNRRSFICAGTSLACLAGTARSAAPVFVDPANFGASFNGQDDDSAAWQAAIDYASGLGGIVRPKAASVSLLQCRSEAIGLYGNLPDTEIFTAIRLPNRPVQIDLNGTQLIIRGHGTRSCVNYGFASDKNLQPGTIAGFSLSNGTLDFNPDGDPSINKRAIHLVGADDIRMENLLLMSSGTRRAGATITLQNCRKARFAKIRGKNVTQGFNFSYVTDLQMDDIEFDNFVEAIDCDRVIRGFTARGLRFANSGPNSQCIDLNSVFDVHISGIEADDVGNIAIVNYKDTTPPNYEDYVAGRPVSTPSPSRNVVIENVRANRVCYPASRTVPFLIGKEQRTASESAFPVENVTLRNVVVTDCPSFVRVELADQVLFENVQLAGLLNPTPDFGALDFRSDFPDSRMRIELRNVQLEMSPNASRGIRVVSPSHMSLTDVTVAGPSTKGVVFYDFHGLDRNAATVRMQKTTAVSRGGNQATAFQFRGQAPTFTVEMDSLSGTVGQFNNAYAAPGPAAGRVRFPQG